MNDFNKPKYKAILPLLNYDCENISTIGIFVNEKVSCCNTNSQKEKKLKKIKNFANEKTKFQSKTIAIKKLILPPIDISPNKYKQLSKFKANYNSVTNEIRKPKKTLMKDSFVVSNRFYRLKIHEEILKVKRRNLELSKKGDKKLFYLQPLKFDNLACIGGATGVGIDEYLFNQDCHVEMVASMIQRLQRIHLREKTKFKVLTENLTADIDFMEKNTFNFTINEGCLKNFGEFKMGLERENVIPNFLRAARQPDPQLLHILLKNILINGIEENDLNFQDVSGRTTLSYLAENQKLIKFIDLIFQVPGMHQANLSDNKGNIPLHYATISDSLFKKMLMYSDPSSMNVKNGEGITPLMKLLVKSRN